LEGESHDMLRFMKQNSCESVETCYK
jgi:hypothetical protein